MSDTIAYTDHALVNGIRITSTRPTSGDTVSGYGGKIATSTMIRYGTRWHRVYVMVYGNSGSDYILSGGHPLFIDIDTEYDILDRRNASQR